MTGRYELRALADGEYAFALKAGNRQVILTSQRHKSRRAALAAIESMRILAASASRYVRKVSSAGAPYFVLVAMNGQIIGRSETYSSAGAMENGISAVMRNAPLAGLDDDE